MINIARVPTLDFDHYPTARNVKKNGGALFKTEQKLTGELARYCVCMLNKNLVGSGQYVVLYA